MTIKVLGSNCPSCVKLKNNVEEAIKNLDRDDVKMEYITNIGKIIDYGVMSTPALLIDEEIKSTGRVLTSDEIKDLINK
jgi:small redox-active disulfide protein 2